MQDDTTIAHTVEQRLCLMLARQEIELLRRWYAHATDLLCNTSEAERDKGLSIYHRIFTPDVDVSVTGTPDGLAARGPDGWADVVVDALQSFEVTQHLIGSQVVTFTGATFDGAELTSGTAEMSSYLHAWHAWPDRRLRLVLGTYEDTVRFDASLGWQIEKMVLVFTSSEERLLG